MGRGLIVRMATPGPMSHTIMPAQKPTAGGRMASAASATAISISVSLWRCGTVATPSGSDGNHGEDVKEYYFYLDSTPTHSYMKFLYKYPQRAYPYAPVVEENRRRGRQVLEYELLDTGLELWDENDGFYSDVLSLPDGRYEKMRVRSMVGLIPLFAVETLEPDIVDRLPGFKRRMQWFIENRPDFVNMWIWWKRPMVCGACSPSSTVGRSRAYCASCWMKASFCHPTASGRCRRSPSTLPLPSPSCALHRPAKAVTRCHPQWPGRARQGVARGVDGTDREINAAEYGAAPDGMISWSSATKALVRSRPLDQRSRRCGPATLWWQPYHRGPGRQDQPEVGARQQCDGGYGQRQSRIFRAGCAGMCPRLRRSILAGSAGSDPLL